MDLRVEKIKDIAVVAVPGENLDASNSRDLKRAMAPVLEGNSRVILDLSALQFVDSSGLVAVLSCLRQLNAKGGDLKIVGLTKPVRALFELVRMHRIFDILNTIEEAVRSFQV